MIDNDIVSMRTIPRPKLPGNAVGSRLSNTQTTLGQNALYYAYHGQVFDLHDPQQFFLLRHQVVQVGNLDAQALRYLLRFVCLLLNSGFKGIDLLLAIYSYFIRPSLSFFHS